jgi:hypothetical protein
MELYYRFTIPFDPEQELEEAVFDRLCRSNYFPDFRKHEASYQLLDDHFIRIKFGKSHASPIEFFEKICYVCMEFSSSKDGLCSVCCKGKDAKHKEERKVLFERKLKEKKDELKSINPPKAPSGIRLQINGEDIDLQLLLGEADERIRGLDVLMKRHVTLYEANYAASLSLGRSVWD